MTKTAAILITFFLGELGVHRYMSGYIGMGILYTLTLGLFGIGWIIDLVKVCTGSYKKKDGTPWVTDETR